MRIIVTGGSGDLGGRVVHELRARGHEVVAASRRSGVDLATGDGLDAVLDGADAVIHSASSQTKPQTVDVAGARRIGESLRRIGSPAQVVSISIVGSDRVPMPTTAPRSTPSASWRRPASRRRCCGPRSSTRWPPSSPRPGASVH
ncbi:NAD-dependent epimerase/dehydratase family protein [Knoellia sp. CPCC 206453]|uniref:SDR family oxidoreductase n=1 Tax=Knoellia pratensis TaxID=3404796 RepID=UPI00360F0D98